jgi:hypothetical protein
LPLLMFTFHFVANFEAIAPREIAFAVALLGFGLSVLRTGVRIGDALDGRSRTPVNDLLTIRPSWAVIPVRTTRRIR